MQKACCAWTGLQITLLQYNINQRNCIDDNERKPSALYADGRNKMDLQLFF